MNSEHKFLVIVEGTSNAMKESFIDKFRQDGFYELYCRRWDKHNPGDGNEPQVKACFLKPDGGVQGLQEYYDERGALYQNFHDGKLLVVVKPGRAARFIGQGGQNIREIINFCQFKGRVEIHEARWHHGLMVTADRDRLRRKIIEEGGILLFANKVVGRTQNFKLGNPSKDPTEGEVQALELSKTDLQFIEAGGNVHRPDEPAVYRKFKGTAGFWDARRELLYEN